MAQLDEPIDDEGEQITERIDTVTWTGGRIRPGEFQEFPVSFQVPEEQPGTELAFPAIQVYSNGEIRALDRAGRRGRPGSGRRGPGGPNPRRGGGGGDTRSHGGAERRR